MRVYIATIEERLITNGPEENGIYIIIRKTLREAEEGKRKNDWKKRGKGLEGESKRNGRRENTELKVRENNWRDTEKGLGGKRKMYTNSAFDRRYK